MAAGNSAASSVNTQIERRILTVLQKCRPNDLTKIHAQIISNGLQRSHFLLSKLVTLCALSGHLSHARRLFDHNPNPSPFLYNAMIRAFVNTNEAIELYADMQRKGLRADNFTYPFLLKACSRLLTIKIGLEAHGRIIKSGFASDVYVGTGLVGMYSNFSHLECARQVFDGMPERSLVSWNAMIFGYVRYGLVMIARQLFDEMTDRDVVSWNSMISGYAKIGAIEDARQLFDQMSQRDVVSWNAMIGGYVQWKRGDEAISMFCEMMRMGVTPNSASVVGVLAACALAGAADTGEWVHQSVMVRCGMKVDVNIGTALIDMYARCGSIDKAHQVFDKMEQRDVGAWNAMISAHAKHGQGKDAIAMFEELLYVQGIKPDALTFVGLLSACSHSGLVELGLRYFESMEGHGVVPGVEHYGCMVDMLGRVGYLARAREVIRSMHIEPHVRIWGALLNACEMHGDVELGEEAIRGLLKLEPRNAGSYVMLSNIYAAADRWVDVARVRKLMKSRRLKKELGHSLVGP